MKETNLLLVSFLVMSLSFADNDFIGFCLLVPKHIDIPLYGSADCAEVNDYVINDTINEDYPLIAIKTLEELGLIKKNEKGLYCGVNNAVKTNLLN